MFSTQHTQIYGEPHPLNTWLGITNNFHKLPNWPTSFVNNKMHQRNWLSHI